MTTLISKHSRPAYTHAAGVEKDLTGWFTLSSAPTSHTAKKAILSISGLPRNLRMAVEEAMAEAIPSVSEIFDPAADPLTADWHTTWSRDRSVKGYYAVRCRQMITGTGLELDCLKSRLEELREQHPGFSFNMAYMR